MSELSKKIKEKISTVRGFGSITRGDIQDMVELIEQQAAKIEREREIGEHLKNYRLGIESKLEIAVKALEFYAKQTIKSEMHHCDGGEQARTALDQIIKRSENP